MLDNNSELVSHWPKILVRNDFCFVGSKGISWRFDICYHDLLLFYNFSLSTLTHWRALMKRQRIKDRRKVKPKTAYFISKTCVTSLKPQPFRDFLLVNKPISDTLRNLINFLR